MRSQITRFSLRSPDIQPPRTAFEGGIQRLGSALWLAMAAMLGACSDSGDLSQGQGGGAPFSPTADGVISDSEVIATLVMDAPAAEDFILSATLPVPPGTLTEGAMTVPLSIAGEGNIGQRS
ncbi:MAG TPA: hypothetical protein P5218_14695, partial [Planctomycetota bacterium]|nr:hypothetical protein [Planctomycetota bacterium]